MKKIENDCILSEKITGNKINFSEIILEINSQTHYHCHHETEIWQILEGEGIVLSNEEQINLKTDDILYLEPFQFHQLTNTGNCKLKLKSIWWEDWSEIHTTLRDQENKVPSNDIYLIGSAFPTPNGPLHLGHLSGPYLLSDIFEKSLKLNQAKTFTYCGNFGHLNHIERCAKKKNIEEEILIKNSIQQIEMDLKSFGFKKSDYFFPYYVESNFYEWCHDLVKELQIKEFIYSKEVLSPYSYQQSKFISESYLSGNCQNCNAMTICIECECCGFVQDDSEILNPYHSDTFEKLIKIKTKKLYFKIENDLIKKLKNLYIKFEMDNYIQINLLNKYFESRDYIEIPVTTFRSNGIFIQGYDGQCISIPMERCLRALYILSNYKENIKEHIFFCGIDNFGINGFVTPSFLLKYGVKENKVPKIFINTLLNLEGKKFSTSQNHAIWAKDFLDEEPLDNVRFYLAKISSTFKSVNFTISDYNENKNLMNTKINHFLKTIEEHCRIYTNYMIPEAGHWKNSDIIFYKKVYEISINACSFLTGKFFSLSKSVLFIEQLVDFIILYVDESNELLTKLTKREIRTRIALELYSLKCFAISVSPIMPNISNMLKENLQITELNIKNLSELQNGNVCIKNICKDILI